jgi:hypothetical protein
MDKRTRGAMVCAAVGLGMAFTATGAAAQSFERSFDRGRNVTVIGGETSQYRAMGMHAGAFTLYPRADLSLNYSDNIYATEDNKVADTYASVMPSLRAVSGWGRHSLQADAGLRLRRYLDNSSENQNGWYARTQGRLDVHGQSYLMAMGEISKQYEQRQSTQSPASAAEPVSLMASTAQLRGVHELNRLRLSAGVAFRGLNYKDIPSITGVPLDLDVKAEYGLSPDTALFGQLTTMTTNYENSAPGFASRDSDQQTALVGANFDISGLMRGEVGVGYTQRAYDDPAFGDIKGVAVTGTLEYFPTRFTTVAVQLSRRAEDAIEFQGGGFFLTSVELQVDHELRHNILLSAAAEYGEESYKSIDRHDKAYGASLGGSYIVNRMLRVNVAAGHVHRNSDGLLRYRNFSENRLTVGLTLQR